jgi:hypothetical protein
MLKQGRAVGGGGSRCSKRSSRVRVVRETELTEENTTGKVRPIFLKPIRSASEENKILSLHSISIKGLKNKTEPLGN